MNGTGQPKAGRRPPGRFWRRARLVFRWMRLVTLGLVLLGAAILLWCNYAGIPSALSGLITTELRRKNIHAEFSKLRLQGFRRIIARDVTFASAASNDLPRFGALSAELLFDPQKLQRGELELSGLRLEQGKVIVPIQASNGTPRFLLISNLVAEVDFLPGDTVRVGSVSAETLGAKVRISGLLRNFSTYTHPSRGPQASVNWERQKGELRKLLDLLETIYFSEPPEMTIRLSGDAADLAGWRGSIRVVANAVTSDQGSFDHLELAAGIFSGRTNGFIEGTFQFDLDGFRSPWGGLAEGRLSGATIWTPEMDQLVTNAFTLSIKGVESRWGRADDLGASLRSFGEASRNSIHTAIHAHGSELKAENHALGASAFEAELQHSLPFPTPAAWLRSLLQGEAADRAAPEVSGNWSLRSSGIALPRLSFDSILISGGISASNLLSSADASAGFWRHLAPVNVPWRMEVTQIVAEEISAGVLRAAGAWAWPRLAVTEMEAQLYGGKLAVFGSFDVESRRGTVSAESSFDYKQMALLLGESARTWLDQFSWETPPSLQANASFQCPAWTNSWTSFGQKILPTLAIAGRFGGGVSFREIMAQNAEGLFSFSNRVLRLPEFLIARPEGNTVVDFSGDTVSGDFSSRIEARFDPGVLASLVPEDKRTGFNFVQFPEAPWISGEAAGNWNRPEEIAFKGRFAVTNLQARGREITDASGDIAYSNLVVEAWNVTAHMGTGLVRAPYLRMDLPAEVMLVTNALSTLDPYNAMFIVGPESYNAIDPYRFAVPPTVKVNGYVPLRHVSKADLWFEIDGREFTFWKFRVPQLTGTVHWRGSDLWITNVDASFYKGRATWEGYFFIHEKEDNADFRFHGEAANADLQRLVADVFDQTNSMEGSFTGKLTVTSARSNDGQSWNGYGEASLRNGLLWSVPVFGVLTPVLDAVIPGAAMSRVTSGTGTFSVTNSVVQTQDLQVRTKAFRLNYRGSVAMDGALDARVEAEIFRDAWLVGKIFSLALWPVSKAFEARISGTVNDPKTKLRYFPRFLFAPFKVLGDLPQPGRTNAPPAPPLRAAPDE